MGQQCANQKSIQSVSLSQEDGPKDSDIKPRDKRHPTDGRTWAELEGREQSLLCGDQLRLQGGEDNLKRP